MNQLKNWLQPAEKWIVTLDSGFEILLRAFAVLRDKTAVSRAIYIVKKVKTTPGQKYQFASTAGALGI
jgi:hypothetical protein